MAYDGGFDSFFREHQSLLARIIRYYVRSMDTAKDLSAEAFIEVHRRWERIRQMDNPTGYLVRVGVNRAKRFLLKAKLTGFFGTVEDDTEVRDVRNRPDEEAVAREEDRWVERELESLKDAEKQVVILRDLENRKFEEISNLLGMKLPTVKSHYRRAKIRLSERLEAEYEGK